MREWFEELFDERYLDFYEGLRRGEPADRDADFLADVLGLQPGARVLDLGCGTGRHAVPLALRGCQVVGVDLSETLLGQARALARRRGADVTWQRRDMRDLGGLGPFDACVCLYTAFGYLGDAGDAQVLAAVHDVLAPGGALVLDVTNFRAVIRTAGGVLWRESETAIHREAHRYDPLTGVLSTERTLFHKGGGATQLPVSRVRAYLPHEVARLLAQAGLDVVRVFGDLADVGFEWDRSPRQVFLAQRAEPEGCQG